MKAQNARVLASPHASALRNKLVRRALAAVPPVEQWLVRAKLAAESTELELLVELRARFPESAIATRGALSSAYNRALARLSDALHRLAPG